MKTRILGQLIMAAISFSFMSDAYAHGDGANFAKLQEVRATCATQLNITLPAKGSGQKLSKEDRQNLFACMKEQGVSFPRHHRHGGKKMQACLANAGVTLPKWQPGVKPVLTDAEKAAVKSCRQQLHKNQGGAAS